MKKSILLFVIFIATFLTLSCEQDDITGSKTITGKGEVVTQTLNLEPFTQIELNGDQAVSLGGSWMHAMPHKAPL